MPEALIDHRAASAHRLGSINISAASPLVLDGREERGSLHSTAGSGQLPGAGAGDCGGPIRGDHSRSVPSAHHSRRHRQDATEEISGLFVDRRDGLKHDA